MAKQEWTQSFQGLEEAGILTVRLPADIPDEQAFRFRSLQEEAARAARRKKGEALLQPATPASSGEDALSPEAEALRTIPPQPPLLFAIPQGKTDALLDRQIASCAGIIEHLAHYIGRYDSAVETCNQFMDRISSMMRSSAEVALAAGRLRGLAAGRGRQ